MTFTGMRLGANPGRIGRGKADLGTARLPRHSGLTRYNGGWASMFRSMKMRLETTLGVRGIEHIGSTAIPGMVARPTIDMLLYVESIDDALAFSKKLEPLGWRTDELSDNPYRTFSKYHMDTPVYRLYVVPNGMNWGEDAVRFRDRLRTDWEVAETYKVLKLKAAGAVGGEEDQMSLILGEFVRDVSKAA